VRSETVDCKWWNINCYQIIREVPGKLLHHYERGQFS
jgi:hypothetical protein